jgi:hypothetical protein
MKAGHFPDCGSLLLFVGPTSGLVCASLVSRITFLFIYLFIHLISEASSFDVTQAGLELSFLLPQPPECWDNRCATLQQYTTAKLLTMTVTRFFLYSPCYIEEFQS